MNCCCCGKPLRKTDVNGWHQACVKHFFETSTIPQIEIDEKTLKAIAKEATNESAQLLHFFATDFSYKWKCKENAIKMQSRIACNKKRCRERAPQFDIKAGYFALWTVPPTRTIILTACKE